VNGGLEAAGLNRNAAVKRTKTAAPGRGGNPAFRSLRTPRQIASRLPKLRATNNIVS